MLVCACAVFCLVCIRKYSTREVDLIMISQLTIFNLIVAMALVMAHTP